MKRSVKALNRAAADLARGACRRSGAGRAVEAAPLLAVGALDDPGREKKGTAAPGAARQHMGRAGGVDNGGDTVYLGHVRAPPVRA